MARNNTSMESLGKVFVGSPQVAMLRRLGRPFIVSRFYDATPTRVCFGKLQAELMPHARYFKHDGTRWVVVPVATALKQARQYEQGGLPPRG
jgi:hypothetical protein